MGAAGRRAAAGAGRGTGAPDPRELQAAVDFVVEKLRPQQIILFGSAARSEMWSGSDLDLLVIREDGPEDHEWRRARLDCEGTAHELDVLVRGLSTVKARRRCSGAVEAAAVEEGRTVYRRDGAETVRTGPERVASGGTMARRTLFRPDKARGFLEESENELAAAQDDRRLIAWRCEMLQRSLERSLKALIIAQGLRVKHTHRLNELWEQAESEGVRIDAARNEAVLERLTLYAGDWSYDRPEYEDPEGTYHDAEAAVEAVLEDARRKVPRLVKETRRALGEPAEADEDPVRGKGP